jgi:hypothetical protein
MGIDVPDRAEFFYAKCGCYRDPAAGDAFDPDAPGPGPGIVTNLNFQQIYVQGEYAANNRFSFYGELPIRFIQPQEFATAATFPNHSGISDVRAGVKVDLLAKENQNLTVQADLVFPTGDALKGLGTNHTSITPTVIYLQNANRVTFQGEFGSIFPIGGSAGVPTSSSDKFAGTILEYGGGLAVELAPASKVQVAPVVEFVAWHILNGFQTSSPAAADGLNIANLKIGVRLGNDRHSFYAGYGMALTDVQWYDKIWRFEYRIGIR